MKKTWTKIMPQLSTYQIFNDCIDNLYNTSLDNKTSEHMSQNTTLEVINFDKVAEQHTFSGTNIITSGFRSNDALIILNNGSQYIFVEFKNGNIDATPNIEFKQEQIRTKINESLWIFNDITGKDVSYTRSNVKYVLVYNKDRNKRFALKKSLSTKAKRKLIINRLEHFFCLFKDIQTLNEDEFNTLINDIEFGSYSF